jgi:hypothetical protein
VIPLKEDEELERIKAKKPKDLLKKARNRKQRV